MKEKNLKYASLVLGIILAVITIVNMSVTTCLLWNDRQTASMNPNKREKLNIAIEANVGRPSPLTFLLRSMKGWFGTWMVGGSEAETATSGITISVTGSNVAGQASVDYYIEGGASDASGNSYRFLEGNGTNISVGGASLTPTNQTTIEAHLEAMGLSTETSQEIDYYVYVLAEATGAVSGESLTSEVTKTLFDTVTYSYGSEITEHIHITQDYDDMTFYYSPDRLQHAEWLMFGDDGASYYDYEATHLFRGCDIPQGTSIISAYLNMYSYGYTSGTLPLTLHFYGEDVDDADQHATHTDYDTSDRTTAYESMEISSWNAGWHTSPDIASIVEEIIGRSGWESGNNIHIYAEDSPGWGGTVQHINWEAHEKGDNHEATLDVTYIGFAASWYDIPPLSVVDMPITLEVGALLVTAVVAGYIITDIRRRGQN